MTDENKQALEKLNKIIQRDGNKPLTYNEYEQLEEVYSYVKALQPKQDMTFEEFIGGKK